ncbi:hypothetical protein [Haloarcula mannanilytica]|uniref:hypothetical protein n=1 Tax=Haloarcula mannanilytica TaxID=2509225 RepID=UPI0010F5EBA5|nr:hypothetical protein [Haloarcula mannanilytica]
MKLKELQQKFETAVDLYQNDGSEEVARITWLKALQSLGTQLNYGITPYEREWDILIVLDACRYDLFTENAPRHQIYDRFLDIEPIYSCASTSLEWMKKSFSNNIKQTQNTFYITANGFVNELDSTHFFDVENVYEYGIDPDFNIVPPEPVTNAALYHYRNSSASKYIIHYAPPHAPFLHCPGKYDSINGNSQNVWDGLRKNKYCVNDVWEDYGQNLLNVLDHVEILLDNMSGKIAITSDHGNAIGEWGIYGHPGYVPIPDIKRVPWIETEGLDLNTYDTNPEDIRSDKELDDQEVEEHLQDLGYML